MMNKAIRGACAVAALVFSSLVATPAFALPALASAVPPSLSGEALVASGLSGSAVCNPASTSPASFSVTGGAVGPYAGTFTESGTASWGPQPAGAVQLVTFHANFTITSPSATIIGTKDITVSVSGGYASDLAFCYAGSNFWFETNATYRVTISLTAGGAFSDSGTATSFVYCGIGCSPIGYIGFMSETFHTSNGVQPLAPTSKEQCKDGLWQNYAQFKNQGDCVSYVNNGK